MNRFSSLGVFLAALCIGVGLVSTSITERADYPIGNFIACMMLGCLMLLAAGVFFFALVLPAWTDRSRTLKDEVRELVTPDQKGHEDSSRNEALITGFRKAFSEFFSDPYITENSSLQNSATQLFWHILYLQKVRMSKRGVSLTFEAERKSYDGLSVTESSYFDGKFRISDMQERIAAKRVYTSSKHKTLTLKDNQAANYSIASAKFGTAKKTAVCPNCGNEADVSNLLDGCDYCGTKFLIEDLEPRISSFALRQDHRIAYEKYKDQRAYFGIRAFLAGAIPIFLISFYMAARVEYDPSVGFGMRMVAIFMTAAFLGACSGFFVQYGFWFAIFPIIQLFHSGKFFTKAAVERSKARESQNERIFQEIRKEDPLFSAEHFYSNVQNKLAAIHYAENQDQICAFAEKDLSALLGRYAHVVDMDVVAMEAESLSFGTDTRIKLKTALKLICCKDGSFSQVKERVCLTLARSSSCKTHAVCEPALLRCKGCGASISLPDGGICHYCGTRANLRTSDWIIEDYEIIW